MEDLAFGLWKAEMSTTKKFTIQNQKHKRQNRIRPATRKKFDAFMQVISNKKQSKTFSSEDAELP